MFWFVCDKLHRECTSSAEQQEENEEEEEENSKSELKRKILCVKSVKSEKKKEQSECKSDEHLQHEQINNDSERAYCLNLLNVKILWRYLHQRMDCANEIVSMACVYKW